MILNLGKYMFLSNVKEKLVNWICDSFNIADYPNLHEHIDVNQLDIINVYDNDVLYKLKLRLKRRGEVTINNLEEYRSVIENIVERPIRFEIVDYKNVNVEVLYLDQEKEHTEVSVSNAIKYQYMPTEEFNEYKVDNIIKYQFKEGEKEGLSFYLGKDLEGNDFRINMLDGSLLIGGMTGAGKSNIVNVLITSLMLTYTENELIFLGCDMAESDVFYFRNHKHFRGMSTTCSKFLEQVDWLERKFKERAKILNEAGCRNVVSYNQKHDTKMSYFVFVIDEVVLLTRDNKCKNKLHDIMCVGRKYGCYFVLCLQDATKDTIGKCKMNCPQVIGLRTNDKTDSNTIIGEGHNLQDIKDVGRCKVKNKNGVTEVQSYFIEEDVIDRLLKDNLKG